MGGSPGGRELSMTWFQIAVLVLLFLILLLLVVRR